MIITGSCTIPLARPEVWLGLNDPEVMARAIPRCQTFTRLEENLYQAALSVQLGILRLPIEGTIAVTDIKESTRYRLQAKGKGLAAAFGEAKASVRLEELSLALTALHYEARFLLAGKLEKLEPAWLKEKADEAAERFFARFIRVLQGQSPDEE